MKSYKVTCLEKVNKKKFRHKIIHCQANSVEDAIEKTSKLTGLSVSSVQLSPCTRIK